jgi:hypothetical protein
MVAQPDVFARNGHETDATLYMMNVFVAILLPNADIS